VIQLIPAHPRLLEIIFIEKSSNANANPTNQKKPKQKICWTDALQEQC
jgi:hypothetical protein